MTRMRITKKTRTFAKKAVSCLAASALALSMLPSATVAAYAADDPFSSVTWGSDNTSSASSTASADIVKIRFEGNADGATGSMDDFTAPFDNEEHALPKAGFAYEGHEFAGWSNTADGKSREDDPKTKDVDESLKAVHVPDGQVLVNLGYSYEKQTKSGYKTVNASLEPSVNGDELVLYAQWTKIGGEEEKQADEPKSDNNADDNQKKAEEPAVEPEGDADGELSAKWTEKGKLNAATVSSDVSSVGSDKSDIAAALEEAGATTKSAKRAAKDIAKAKRSSAKLGAGAEEEMPWQADGNSVDSITARWITEDTANSAGLGADPALLYMKASGDNPLECRLRITYALSGEKDYEAGDIVFTLPANIFTDRDGKELGTIVIPYAEDPSQKGTYNWKQVGDKIVITNTKRLKAATKGFMDIAFQNLTPHMVRDMATYDWEGAKIEVNTAGNNIIGKVSNTLTAQIDTEAVVQSANKKRSGTVDVVSAAEVPEDCRKGGEENYVRVNWYTWGYTNANQLFDLDLVDTVTDEYISATAGHADGDDKLKTERVYEDGYSNQDTRYSHFSVYYPFSQFEPETDYTFKNSVTYTLTETDPAAGDDPQLVTTKSDSAQVVWRFHEPKFVAPTGHFKVWKAGNDGDNWAGVEGAEHSNWESHHNYYSPTRDYYNVDVTRYGVYPSALNQIRLGNDVELGYITESVGYMLPWTLEKGADYKVLANYGKRAVRMTTTDKGLTGLVAGEDYWMTGVDFGVKPTIYKATSINLNPDGSIAARFAGDGTFGYAIDEDATHIPVFTLEGEVNGQWTKLATVDWTSGEAQITCVNGASVEGTTVTLPAKCTNVRTVCDATVAGLISYFRPLATLNPNSKKIKDIAEDAFKDGKVPMYAQYNGVHLEASYADDGETIVTDDERGYDMLYGYTTDIRAVPSKSAKQTLSDIDFGEGTIKVHYSAKVEERSTITDLGTYREAVRDTAIIPETAGTWRDLLPIGVTPDLQSIRLRDGDAIERAYTIEDWRDTGRTLLVVEAKLKHSPTRYTEHNLKYWEDVPEIRFDATYTFEGVRDYGAELHNVISFESSRGTIGTVENYQGEPDDPKAGRNVETQNAFASEEELNAMTNLNSEQPPNERPATVYAGCTTRLDLLGRGNTSLSKDVDVNGEGEFSPGTYEDHKTVFEGGQYTYRLTMVSNAGTTSKDMILYDSLENYVPKDGNDDADVAAYAANATWKGKLRRLDVSQIEARGGKPVIYYSTVSNLQLEDADENKIAANADLGNTSVWTRADLYDGSMDDVKAFAVDLRKRADGSDFELPETESVTVLAHMKAPYGDSVRPLIENKGAWGDSAMAYNNAFLDSTSVDNETLQSERDWVRKDYTKVGIEEMNLEVTKTWNDDNNRDGIRPTSATIHLLADGEDTGKTATVDASNEWHAVFEHLPYTNPDGDKVIYSFSETSVEGYEANVVQYGNIALIENKHEPEKTSISGHKVWTGDEGVERDARPAAITVKLLANGTEVSRKGVSAGVEGNWAYSFDNLYKYENGTEIDYTVEETSSGEESKFAAYVGTVDGYEITNTYHPFGDLTVSKEVEDGTAAVADKEFEFTFRFKKGDDGVFDEFAYTTSDGRTGTVATDGTVKLKAGQTVTVSEIPQGVTYQVVETQEPGFKVTNAKNSFGTIYPNRTASAEFTNLYKTAGRADLSATKTLTGRDIMRYQFKFDVYDVTGLSDEEAATDTSKIVRSATNAADGSVTFAAIKYSNADAGKTYRYRIEETDRGKPGYTYDKHVEYATVHVVDNGDGTMTATPEVEAATWYTYAADPEGTWYKKADGSFTQDAPTASTLEEYGLEDEAAIETAVKYARAEKSHAAGQPAAFENAYDAEGHVDLKAWKNLVGRKLADKEFQFALWEVDEDGNAIADGVRQLKRNDANGEVVWDPIVYDETDAGKTFYYLAAEVTGSDDTVNYSDEVKCYKVTVADNGDGTLSCTTGNLVANRNVAETGGEKPPLVQVEEPDVRPTWDDFSLMSPEYDYSSGDSNARITKYGDARSDWCWFIPTNVSDLGYASQAPTDKKVAYVFLNRGENSNDTSGEECGLWGIWNSRPGCEDLDTFRQEHPQYYSYLARAGIDLESYDEIRGYDVGYGTQGWGAIEAWDAIPQVIEDGLLCGDIQFLGNYPSGTAGIEWLPAWTKQWKESARPGSVEAEIAYRKNYDWLFEYEEGGKKRAVVTLCQDTITEHNLHTHQVNYYDKETDDTGMSSHEIIESVLSGFEYTPGSASNIYDPSIDWTTYDSIRIFTAGFGTQGYYSNSDIQYILSKPDSTVRLLKQTEKQGQGGAESGEPTLAISDEAIDITTDEAPAPLFTNTLKDGGVRIEKRVTGDSEGYDPDTTFKFRLELTNEDGTPVNIDEESANVSELADPTTPTVEPGDGSGNNTSGGSGE